MGKRDDTDRSVIDATEELRADEMTAEEAIQMVLKRPEMYGLQKQFKPAEDDREAAFESGMEMVDWGMVRDGVGDPQDAAGIAVRAALEAHAAVPDAATEQVKGELAAALELRAHWRSKAIEARAERDAALAAIERIREMHSPVKARYQRTHDGGPEDLCRECGASWPCATAESLDGAPEPEWEYGYTSKWGTQTEVSREGAERQAKLIRDEIEQGRSSGDLEYDGLVRKRVASVPAGPWLPVEGESKP